MGFAILICKLLVNGQMARLPAPLSASRRAPPGPVWMPCRPAHDEHTYYQATDFTSPQALNAFNHYRQIEQAYQETSVRLEQLRNQYAAGDTAAKNRLRNSIQQEELREKELYEQMIKTSKEIRQMEKP